MCPPQITRNGILGLHLPWELQEEVGKRSVAGQQSPSWMRVMLPLLGTSRAMELSYINCVSLLSSERYFIYILALNIIEKPNVIG